MKRIFVCLLLVIFLAPAAHAGGTGSNPYDLSKILFPETRTWQNVDSLPRPDMKMILRDRWLLRSIYLKTRQSMLIERPECSFITRALYEHLDEGLLRSVDMDGDGIADVVYFGPNQCDEGFAAVVWLEGPDGLLERDAAIIPYQVLRIETTESRRICGVEPGCCAGVVDEYFMGDLPNPWGLMQMRVHKRLVLPQEMKIARDGYEARHKLDLRLAPSESNECNRDIDNTDSPWVIGNIVATYGPGAKGNILAHFKDDEGRHWGLVAIDRASAVLCSERGEPCVEVGWIRVD